MIAACELGGCRWYFGKKHGAKTDIQSQIGLTSLQDFWMTAHKEFFGGTLGGILLRETQKWVKSQFSGELSL